MDEDNIKTFSIAGYQRATSYFRNALNWGGCAIWAKDGVNYKKISLERHCVDQDIEICGIVCKNYFQQNIKSDLLLLLLYRSPTGNYEVFYDKLFDVLNFTYRPNRKIILCGDFNIDPERDECHFKRLQEVVSNFSMFPINNWPTRL